MKKPRKHVPRDRDPSKVPGSSDSGIAPEWPHQTYADEHSAVVPGASDDQTTGKKAPEPGDF